MDVISARDGHRVAGFPFTFGWTSVTADPVLYDIDEDGYDEIVVATMGGEIVFINRYGEVVAGRTFKIPKARVPRKWYAGLDDKSTTVYMSLADATRYEKQVLKSKDEHFVGRKIAPSSKLHIDEEGVARKTYKGTTSKVDLKSYQTDSKNDLRPPTLDANRMTSGKEAWKGFEGWLTDEGLDSLQLFLASRPLTETEEMDALFSPQYAHWMQSHPDHHQFPQSDSIFVDAHIYDAPVFADLDGDGWKEMIVAVNYYFDDSITSKPKRVAKYPLDTDFTKYVSCGVVVFSMKREQIEWISPLELTTDASQYIARIFSTPTVADLDNDGKLDIVVGTGVGSVYVLGQDGLWNPRLARSINTDVIGAPIVAADINGDGKMNLLVADDAGTLVCFDADGTEIWETRVASSVNHAPILGDVDGDGTLDVVVSAVAGHVWAVSGLNGKPLKGFPIKLSAVLNTAPLLVPFPPFRSKRPWDPQLDGLAIIVHPVDGIVHNIHAKTGCIEKIDIGESSMGMILADDLTGNGYIDLLISMAEGHLICLSTGAPLSSSAAAWRSRRDGRNAFAIGVWQGVRLNEDTKQKHYVSGNTFRFSFEIIDMRPARGPNHRYIVRLWHGTRLWYEGTVFSRGLHTATISTPEEIMSASLTLEVVNEHGQAFFDTWNVGFNLTWYRTLKWLVALPVIFMSLALLFVKDVVHFLP